MAKPEPEKRCESWSPTGQRCVLPPHPPEQRHEAPIGRSGQVTWSAAWDRKR